MGPHAVRSELLSPRLFRDRRAPLRTPTRTPFPIGNNSPISYQIGHNPHPRSGCIGMHYHAYALSRMIMQRIAQSHHDCKQL